jgi:hypothetical protein
MKNEIGNLVKKIKRIKQEISNLGDMRPGSLSKQYNKCGNPNCRCKDKKNPRQHGPYYQISYSRHGRSKTEFVTNEMAPRIRKELRNYKRFVALNGRLIDLSIELSRARRSYRGEFGNAK